MGEAMKIKFILPFAVALATIAAPLRAVGQEQGARPQPPAALVGTWVGTGQHLLAASILRQRDIACTLVLGADGTVGGWVGEAKIIGGSFYAAPWIVALLDRSKYQVRVRLEGPIAASEGFARSGGVFILKKPGPGGMSAGFNSTGGQTGPGLFLPIRGITLVRNDK
jgi:hypothetical protein